MTCRQASEAITRVVDGPLSISWRVGLRVHTLFCGPCRRFRGQMVRLHALCQDLREEEIETVRGGLSVEARARIVTALESSPSPE
jgi:hypothetical protein